MKETALPDTNLPDAFNEEDARGIEIDEVHQEDGDRIFSVVWIKKRGPARQRVSWQVTRSDPRQWMDEGGEEWVSNTFWLQPISLSCTRLREDGKPRWEIDYDDQRGHYHYRKIRCSDISLVTSPSYIYRELLDGDRLRSPFSRRKPLR